MASDFGKLVIGQLEFYWDVYFRPRLDGLANEEYLWEPVPACWSLRQDADGAFHIESTNPEPNPSPVTTIGWRLMHVATNIHSRASTFFGDGSIPGEADMFDPRHVPSSVPGNAREGIAFLDRTYRWWMDGLASLDEQELARPLGPRGARYFASEPMLALAVHVNREVMHHGGEILLLRDLYRATGASPLAK